VAEQDFRSLQPRFGAYFGKSREQSGKGDLRPYALVQFLPVLLIPVMLGLFPARYSGVRYILEMIGWFLLSKLPEYFDAVIWGWSNGWVSGHSVKHCVAGGAIYALVRYLKYRRAIPDSSLKPIS